MNLTPLTNSGKYTTLPSGGGSVKKEQRQKAFRYMNEYAKDKYDRIVVLVPKGEKERYEAVAKSMGFSSVSKLFVNAAKQIYGL